VPIAKKRREENQAKPRKKRSGNREEVTAPGERLAVETCLRKFKEKKGSQRRLKKGEKGYEKQCLTH